MNRYISTTFIACLLVGCVTVSEQETDSTFDKMKAADARIELGLGYLKAGNMVKARENLELAVSYAPDYYRSQSSLAYLYSQIGENRLAEVAYKKALRESPDNGDILNNYGAFLCKCGEYEKADAFFNRVIELPDYYLVSGSYENAAVCAVKAGDITKAEYYFKRALDHDPGRYIASFQLAKIELGRGEYENARDRLLKFHQKYGYKPLTLGLLRELEEKTDSKSQE